MLGDTPSIEISQTSEYGKERAKWESEHGRFGSPGRPYKYMEFPKRMSKATRGAKGPEFEGATANNDAEEAQLKSVGFHFGRGTALDALTRDEAYHGQLAAEREHEIHHGKRSPGAVREIRAAEEAVGSVHLPEVPVSPIKRRTRGPNKPKAQKVTV